jgi:hypothetical protein
MSPIRPSGNICLRYLRKLHALDVHAIAPEHLYDLHAPCSHVRHALRHHTSRVVSTSLAVVARNVVRTCTLSNFLAILAWFLFATLATAFAVAVSPRAIRIHRSGGRTAVAWRRVFWFALVVPPATRLVPWTQAGLGESVTSLVTVLGMMAACHWLLVTTLGMPSNRLRARRTASLLEIALFLGYG